MHDQTARSVPLSVAMAALGPVAIGVIIGLPFGPFSAAHEAVAIPVLIFGVTALMVPALYVATAVVGAAPAARDFGRSVAAALRSCGVAMLGLAAPAAFLIATGGADRDLPSVIGAAVLAGSMLIALRGLYRSLFPENTALVQVVVYIAWACLALIIGMLFYSQNVAV